MPGASVLHEPAGFLQVYNGAEDDMLMQGIHLTAYSPLGTPDSAVMQNRGEETPHLMSDPAVKKIADKHGKHTAPVSLLTHCLFVLVLTHSATLLHIHLAMQLMLIQLLLQSSMFSACSQ